ncbi:S8 family serine peptidase [Actinoplanes couchii]|uniref:S8 family serine peptidase n=1 Tax=Actinoplanes couchii TaxID=403638 RepID=UPI00285CDE4C|nr:type VII secretion-associated serine protease mycosin [Actinoplanes couchii]
MRFVAAVVVGLVAGVVVPVSGPAVAATCTGAGVTSPGVPAELKAYAPSRLAGLATGAGVRVAVIDSGVDPRNPQLAGKVLKGRDFLHKAANALSDCPGHGTAVAGIIAGQPDANTGVQGLAPGATIVPVRVSEDEDVEGSGSGASSAASFAQAIRWSVNQAKASVLNISLVMPAQDPAVRAAIAEAVAADVVVVAASGNDGADGGVAFPAGYPGVIGVGAVAPDGSLASFSQTGEHVDIVAFGQAVTALAPISGHRGVQGTSFAAPFVAATAALLRERFPAESAEQIGRRLLRSADPAPGGARSDGFGVGLLNPYRALTEQAGPKLAAVEPASPVPVARRGGPEWDRAGLFAAGGAGLVVLAGLVVAVVVRGRRRGWHPATAGESTDHDRMPG